MRVVWKLNSPTSARRIHVEVKKKHAVELLTVITVLNNLVGKRLLGREKQDEVFHYHALVSHDEFIGLATRWAVEGILSLGPAAVTASFVDVLEENDPDRLDELARLVRRRLKERDRE